MTERSQKPHLGPLPGVHKRNHVRNLSTARSKILELLREGPCTVSSLAMRTGQHENTIREHLEALVLEDLAIKYQSTEHVRGRPAWFYRTSDQSDQSEIGEYAGLASALAGAIARSSAHPVHDAINAGTAWAPELVRNSALNHNGAIKKNAIAVRRNVVSVLNHLGFAPKENVDYTRIKLTRCPMLDAARQNPEIICSVHLGIIRGALSELGADATNIDRVHLAPFSEPGACLLKL